MRRKTRGTKSHRPKCKLGLPELEHVKAAVLDSLRSLESRGELEQIQSLLGRVAVQTAEKYLSCKQRFREAVKDKIGIERGP